MESIELKCRLIESSEFVVRYTEKVVEILRGPELSLEVKAGKISEDVLRLIESLGYKVQGKKAIEDWVQIKAIRKDN